MSTSTLYVETSIISYLAAQPSRDLITAGRQQVTREWWENRRPSFELFVSELVIREAAAGDPEAAARRSAILSGLPVIEVSATAEELAAHILGAAGLPARSAADALHVAVAAAHGMEYLLTWNVTHLANAQLRPRVERACREQDYEPPVLCTPDELIVGADENA